MGGTKSGDEKRNKMNIKTEKIRNSVILASYIWFANHECSQPTNLTQSSPRTHSRYNFILRLQCELYTYNQLNSDARTLTVWTLMLPKQFRFVSLRFTSHQQLYCTYTIYSQMYQKGRGRDQEDERNCFQRFRYMVQMRERAHTSTTFVHKKKKENRVNDELSDEQGKSNRILRLRC